MVFSTLFKTIEEVYKNNLPFVIYKKPNEEKVNFIHQKNDAIVYSNNLTESGFIFSPFDAKENTILFKDNNKDSAKIPDQLNYSLNETLRIEIDNNDKRNHINLVRNGIERIKSSEINKIVLSRREELNYNTKDALSIFKKLVKMYNNAFVYLWYHPKIGLWLGATPETLLKINGQTFYTMALAGTQAYKDTLDVSWEEKEIQEQQYVTDFISNALKPIIPNLNLSKSYTVKAGNLLHIRTDIKGNITDSDKLLKLISVLHPTPAVCGLPKEEAKQFILENELYNRTFYTGFLGELNIEGQSNLYVNLRCMQIEENRIYIYVGGGITIDSNAENEWEETVIKAKVMKEAL